MTPSGGRSKCSACEASCCCTALLSASRACNDGTPPPATPPTIAVTLEAGAATNATGGGVAAVAASNPPASAMPPAASAGDAGADFYSVGVDSDCVAVPKATCCPNGSLEAVNKQSVEAYRSSLVCERRHRICPQFRVIGPPAGSLRQRIAKMRAGSARSNRVQRAGTQPAQLSERNAVRWLGPLRA